MGQQNEAAEPLAASPEAVSDLRERVRAAHEHFNRDDGIPPPRGYVPQPTEPWEPPSELAELLHLAQLYAVNLRSWLAQWFPEPTVVHRRLMSPFGTRRGTFDRLVLAQSGRCAGCLEPLVVPCLDHCHKTDEYRGLLCATCNSALGFAKDSPDTLRRLADYLLDPPARSIKP